MSSQQHVDLWTVHKLAQYAYCPRSFYLQQVENIFLPSPDTEEGAMVHRRVDTPSRLPEDLDLKDTQGRTRTLRSLWLTSDIWRLSGRIDLIEIKDGVAVPIEYRKGRPCHEPMLASDEETDPYEEADQSQTILNAPRPWPNDRFQMGLYCLLLQEKGYRIDHAVIYYAAEKRKILIHDIIGLIKETRSLLQQARETAAAPQRPPPLYNDPRCARCSLQPLCLPDEINKEKHKNTATPRSLWPVRDDGIHVFAQSEGLKIGIRGKQLRFTGYEGETIKTYPLIHIESITLVGAVQISTQALHILADRGVPVAFLSPAGRLIAMVDPMTDMRAHIRQSQILSLMQEQNRLTLSRSVVRAKILNQRVILKRNLGKDTIDEDLGAMLRLAHKAEQAPDLMTLRGIEGQAAAVYFKNLARLLQNESAADFTQHGRERRPPPDPVNACLSLAYTLLTHESTAALRTAGLDPSIGAYHSIRAGRPALALDLMEPFRPLIADSLVLSGFNRREFNQNHFITATTGCNLTADGRSVLFSLYGRRMNTEITHPVFRYRMSYRRMLILHARMLAAWFRGDIETLSFLTTR